MLFRSAAPPRDSRDSDQRLAARWQRHGARQGGTTMPSIAAPSHTGAARRGAPGVKVHSRGRAGLAGGRRRRPGRSACRRGRTARAADWAKENQIYVDSRRRRLWRVFCDRRRRPGRPEPAVVGERRRQRPWSRERRKGRREREAGACVRLGFDRTDRTQCVYVCHDRVCIWAWPNQIRCTCLLIESLALTQIH